MFDWAGYLALAEELAGRPDEASQRSAVSRAYYAAFHRARLFLTHRGIALRRDGTDHDRVWSEVERFGARDREALRAGTNGRRLKDRRRKADCDAAVLDFRGTARVAIITARGILQDVDALARRHPIA